MNIEFDLEFNENKLKFEEMTKITRHYFNMNNNKNLLDIQLCNQGIDWTNITRSRDNLRKHRLIHHKGYRSKEMSQEEQFEIEYFFNSTINDIFYQFGEMYIEIPITVQHFQLRKNLKMLSESEIVYIRTHGIEKMNIVTQKRRFLVLFQNEDNEDRGKIVNFDIVRMSDKLLIVCGKMDGNIILYTLDDNECDYRQGSAPKYKSILRKRVSDEGELQITNNVKFLENGKKLLICSNDSHIKIFDLEDNFKLLKIFKAPNAVNHCAINNCECVLAAVGDFETVELYDFKNCQKFTSIKGHRDFGFSSYFSPYSDNFLFTGNQDYSCKIWDIRKMGNEQMIDSLNGHFDSIGEMQFIKDEFLVYSENTDYLHIYNLKTNTLQSLDYFGSSAGLCIHPHTNKIFLAISEYGHFGIMTYDKINDNIIDINNLLI